MAPKSNLDKGKVSGGGYGDTSSIESDANSKCTSGGDKCADHDQGQGSSKKKKKDRDD